LTLSKILASVSPFRMGDCYTGELFFGLAGAAVCSPMLYHIVYTVRPGSRACIACTAILPDNLIDHEQGQFRKN
jgi:hypothetical protein